MKKYVNESIIVALIATMILREVSIQKKKQDSKTINTLPTTDALKTIHDFIEFSFTYDILHDRYYITKDNMKEIISSLESANQSIALTDSYRSAYQIMFPSEVGNSLFKDYTIESKDRPFVIIYKYNVRSNVIEYVEFGILREPKYSKENELKNCPCLHILYTSKEKRET